MESICSAPYRQSKGPNYGLESYAFSFSRVFSESTTQACYFEETAGPMVSQPEFVCMVFCLFGHAGDHSSVIKCYEDQVCAALEAWLVGSRISDFRRFCIKQWLETRPRMRQLEVLANERLWSGLWIEGRWMGYAAEHSPNKGQQRGGMGPREISNSSKLR